MRYLLAALLVVSVYAACPRISGVSTAPTAGGVTVIPGSFAGMDGAMLKITVAGQACQSPSVNANKNEIKCTVAAGYGYGHMITITDGTNELSGFFNYLPPSIDSITPASVAGGQITIKGKNFGMKADKLEVYAGGKKCDNLVLSVAHSEIKCNAIADQGENIALFLTLSGRFARGTFNYANFFKVSGIVKSALDARRIPNAKVTLRHNGKNATDSTVQSTTTDSNGIYTFAVVPVGKYNLTAEATDFLVDRESLTISRNIDAGTIADLSLSPLLAKNSYRVVLKWGAQPTDLDSFMGVDNNTCSVYYNNRVCKRGNATATLDLDATNGYGPETMTILEAVGHTFSYHVQLYSGSGDWSGSKASVTLYSSNNPEGQTFTPSKGWTDAKNWKVFNITSDGKIVPIMKPVVNTTTIKSTTKPTVVVPTTSTHNTTTIKSTTKTTVVVPTSRHNTTTTIKSTTKSAVPTSRHNTTTTMKSTTKSAVPTSRFNTTTMKSTTKTAAPTTRVNITTKATTKPTRMNILQN